MGKVFVDPLTFPVGSRVRYRPGTGSYGPVTDAANRQPDGCVSATVVGHSATRVRCVVKMTPPFADKTVTVDGASLALETVQ